jgi:cytochrome c oxidase subunit 2
MAGGIESLTWFFIAVCTVVWLLTMAALGFAMLRRRRTDHADPLKERPRADRLATLAVSGLVALTAVILVVLTAATFLTGKSLADMQGEGLVLRVTGQQWWWQVTYESDQPSRVLTVANEIHVPVGETVTLKLTSADVIHSFWVPSLAGKTDLIPRRTNIQSFVVDRPGTYRGQCAEFCGFQHAHMGLLVIAHPRAEFDAWYEAQLKPAERPSEAGRQRGEQVFTSRACAMCHGIRGTSAAGRVAPDLTHVGSQQTIGAGTLPMSEDNLARWIADPHHFKPGVNMPKTDLSGEDIGAVAAYLAGLK